MPDDDAMTRPDLPHAPSTERNRSPILAVLRQQFADRRTVLEVGSGTGQHAVHFAAALPHLRWQCSDRAGNLPGIAAWLADAALANTLPPLAYDVNDGPPVAGPFDAVFSANTLHIMSWPEVTRLFAQLPALMTPAARLVIYGPFNVGGGFTSDSNARFDASLKADDPRRGIRDVAAVDALATAVGLTLVADLAMPSHNRCRVWDRRAAKRAS